MITLDTSALLALLDRKEGHHEEVKAALLADGGPYLCPVGILAEVAYMVEVRLGQQALEALLDDLIEGAYVLAPVEGDLRRIRELLERYADLPLGFSDACMVACAEGHGGSLLSLDKHFAVVTREGMLRLLPEVY